MRWLGFPDAHILFQFYGHAQGGLPSTTFFVPNTVRFPIYYSSVGKRILTSAKCDWKAPPQVEVNFMNLDALLPKFGG
jgi:hypothetical protein